MDLNLPNRHWIRIMWRKTSIGEVGKIIYGLNVSHDTNEKLNSQTAETFRVVCSGALKTWKDCCRSDKQELHCKKRLFQCSLIPNLAQKPNLLIESLFRFNREMAQLGLPGSGLTGLKVTHWLVYIVKLLSLDLNQCSRSSLIKKLYTFFRTPKFWPGAARRWSCPICFVFLLYVLQICSCYVEFGYFYFCASYFTLDFTRTSLSHKLG